MVHHSWLSVSLMALMTISVSGLSLPTNSSQNITQPLEYSLTWMGNVFDRVQEIQNVYKDAELRGVSAINKTDREDELAFNSILLLFSLPDGLLSCRSRDYFWGAWYPPQELNLATDIDVSPIDRHRLLGKSLSQLMQRAEETKLEPNPARWWSNIDLFLPTRPPDGLHLQLTLSMWQSQVSRPGERPDTGEYVGLESDEIVLCKTATCVDHPPPENAALGLSHANTTVTRLRGRGQHA